MFDLHTHTSASDGTLTPFELVRLAVKTGLRYMAITDHDTVHGIEEATWAAEQFGRLKIIPGVELSVEVARGEIHILGYFVNPHHEALATRLIDIRSARMRRAVCMMDKLAALGMTIPENILRNYQAGESIGRPHIARAMAEAGFVGSVREAFEKYLARGGACYVPREKLDLREALQLILDAGGIPVVAHPGFIEDFSEHFPELLKFGLLGIEAIYPYHSPLQTDYFISLAREHNLTITAGTDFHGADIKKAHTPGFAGISMDVLYDFLDFCSERTRIQWYSGRKHKEKEVL